MPRSFTYQALTLRVKPSGESNREAWFLTAEEGVLRATVFGGPKSRLRARVAPFHEGRLWIYHDPVRDSRKVSDFDVVSYRAGIRELYERAMAADAVAETILCTHGGGGDWQTAAKLAAGILDAINDADAPLCTRLGIYFLWRWAGALGVQPDLSACASCACEAAQDKPLWYTARSESLLCENCLREQPAFSPPPAGLSPLHIGPGALRWLKETSSLPPAALSRITLDTPSTAQAKALSTAVLAAALGRNLPTWEGI